MALSLEASQGLDCACFMHAVFLFCTVLLCGHLEVLPESCFSCLEHPGVRCRGVFSWRLARRALSPFLSPSPGASFAGCHQTRKEAPLVLVALRVLTVECDLLALLSGTQVWFVRVCQPPRDSKVRRFCGHRAAGVSSANENHLASCMGQMGARWEQSGGRAGQPGAVASGLFPLPIASASFHPCLLECQVVQDWAATSPEGVNQSLSVPMGPQVLWERSSRWPSGC